MHPLLSGQNPHFVLPFCWMSLQFFSDEGDFTNFPAKKKKRPSIEERSVKVKNSAKKQTGSQDALAVLIPIP